jgi:hypothetical protein
MGPTNLLCNLGRAYLSLGAEVCTNSLRITSSYGLRALNGMVANWGEWNQPKLAQKAIVELQNYCTEMATLIPFALERLGTDEALMMAPDPEYPGGDGFPSSPGAGYLIGDKPMMLPVRVGEASQGWALYFVPCDWAKSRLGELDKQFIAVDAGSGRAALIIFAIDHRQSDLGTYVEIGVALVVRPRSNPRDLPGLLFLSLIVSDQFTIDASRTIWGYRKSLAKNMDVRYGDSFVTFCVDALDAAAFSVSFPRFGSGRSSRVPWYIYSVPERDQDAAAHRTILSRSAANEGIQMGGAVGVHLSSAPGCVCRSDTRADDMCICAMLRDLPLPDRPAANGWSELVFGAFGAAIPCR